MKRRQCLGKSLCLILTLCREVSSTNMLDIMERLRLLILSIVKSMCGGLTLMGSLDFQIGKQKEFILFLRFVLLMLELNFLLVETLIQL